MTKPDAYPYAHRLALELECLLLECKDTAAVSKWWDSAHEALEQWREFCRESLQDARGDRQDSIRINGSKTRVFTVKPAAEVEP